MFKRLHVRKYGKPIAVRVLPDEVVQDNVYFTGLLANPADISVGIGGHDVTPTWTHTPPKPYSAGFYHGSAPFSGNTGEVIVNLARDGVSVMTITGNYIDDLA